jgi:membrane protein implicated in regulation of membrane protease activity
MMQTLLNSTQTLIFLGIALASFVAVAGTFLFGDHHELAGDHDFGDHEISFFSPKIIFSFTLGFGAAGTICSAYGLRNLWCVGAGLLMGVLLSALAYGMMALFYKQQASSIIPTSAAVGRIGNVTSAIPEHGAGEIGLDVGEYRNYLARSKNGSAIAKGMRVKVVENQAGELIVEPDVPVLTARS